MKMKNHLLKKLGILLAALCVAISSPLSVFASDDIAEEEKYIGEVTTYEFHDSETAVPLATNRTRAVLTYGWSCTALNGSLGGASISAGSSATESISSMYIKVEIQETGITTSKNQTKYNVSSLDVSLYSQDVTTAKLLYSKSTHTFKNTGYQDATKYVIRYPS